MKKGWIMVMFILGIFFTLQQAVVLSQKFVLKKPKTTKTLGPASNFTDSSNSTPYGGYASCSNPDIITGYNNLRNENNMREDNADYCIADDEKELHWCCACFCLGNIPDVCYRIYPDLLISPTQIPTNTPTPTPLPIDCRLSQWSACSSSCGPGTKTRHIVIPASNGGRDCGERSTSCANPACPEEGVGGFTPGGMGGSSANSDSPIIILGTNNSMPPPKTYLPTWTPIPTLAPSLTPTKIPPSSTQTIRNENASPDNLHSPYVPPTITAIPLPTITSIPTPTPIPTSPASIIPKNLTNQKTVTNQTTYISLNANALADIRISANTNANTDKKSKEKRLLPREEKQTQSEVAVTGGILVTLQQKVGEAFVTRQDELTVKRGNQFFTIKNQPSTPETNKAQVNQSNDAAPHLEINANNVIAQSSMGLSVDPLSGILTVETSTGPKKVSIMPDEALGIVMELKALNDKGGVETSILLVSEKGSLIYRISGFKAEKFLGLLPITIQKQVLISADTGSLVKVELSFLAQILSYFTF